MQFLNPTFDRKRGIVGDTAYREWIEGTGLWKDFDRIAQSRSCNGDGWRTIV
jgi:hypothetical protein